MISKKLNKEEIGRMRLKKAQERAISGQADNANAKKCQRAR